MIGKLEPVQLREVWAHEASDFTSWLFENIEVLNEVIGLELTVIEKEKSVGSFNVDILCEDSFGQQVIIENQLEKTDHDHLGKLLTYLSNLDAKIAIWISSQPRPEHVAAIEYLNKVVPEDTRFYLLRLQAFKIGNSESAPLFTIEAGPSEQLSAVGDIKKETAHRDKAQYRFFEQLLNKCNLQCNLFSSVSSQGYQNWISAGAGRAGLLWHFVIMKKTSKVELFLSASNGETNRRRFEFLSSRKKEIEDDFGEPLIWNFREGRKQHYIQSYAEIGGFADENKWPETQDDLIRRLICSASKKRYGNILMSCHDCENRFGETQ